MIGLRDRLVGRDAYDPAGNVRPKIRFIGVWDTVSAYGGPITEITRAIDNWFWRETAAAKVFVALREACLASDDKSLKPLGQTTLVPRWVQHELAHHHG